MFRIFVFYKLNDIFKIELSGFIYKNEEILFGQNDTSRRGRDTKPHRKNNATVKQP